MTTTNKSSSAEKRVSVILRGTGIRGLAHIGALQAVEERQLCVDCLTCSSLGAVIGTLWVNGFTAQQIEKLLLDEAADNHVNPWFWLGGKHVSECSDPICPAVIDLLDHAREFVKKNKLEVKPSLRIVAYEVQTEEPVVFEGTYDLGAALAATCSMPGVHRPVRIGGQVLVDGSLVQEVAGNGDAVKLTESSATILSDFDSAGDAESNVALPNTPVDAWAALRVAFIDEPAPLKVESDLGRTTSKLHLLQPGTLAEVGEELDDVELIKSLKQSGYSWTLGLIDVEDRVENTTTESAQDVCPCCQPEGETNQ